MSREAEVQQALAAEYVQLLPPDVLSDVMMRRIAPVTVSSLLGKFTARCGATGVVEHFELADSDSGFRVKMPALAARLYSRARSQL